jgi:hypothetical protein
VSFHLGLFFKDYLSEVFEGLGVLPRIIISKASFQNGLDHLAALGGVRLGLSFEDHYGLRVERYSIRPFLETLQGVPCGHEPNPLGWNQIRVGDKVFVCTLEALHQ